ncbi:MAG: metallophosphoesterase family protein [Candidatus Hodarchaeota archaeon]
MRIKSSKIVRGRTTSFILLVVLLFAPFLAVIADFPTNASAKDAFIASRTEETDLIWFAQITDLHVGRRANIENTLPEFLLDLSDFVKPSFVLATGDLVEGDYTHVEANLTEWVIYDSIISSVADNLNYDYYDVPGNHDNLDNNNLSLFLQYSHIGRNFGTTHHSWTIEKGGKAAQFIGINTADTVNGESIISYEGRITESEIAFLKLELEKPADARVVFGHHSPVEVEWGYHISDTPEKEELLKLLEAPEVLLYANGHLHKERIVRNRGTLFLTADNWPNFRLFVVDLERKQTSSFEYDASPITWPIILPVFPVNQSQMIRSQGMLIEGFPLEILVFSASVVEEVSVDPGNGTWIDLTKSGNFLWSLREDEYIELHNETIRIQASDQLGRRREIQMTLETSEEETSQTKSSALGLFAILAALVILPSYNLRKKQQR